MKARMPGSIKDAVTIMMAGLGPARCAEIIERSESLVYKMADPDSDSEITLKWALMLEVEYMKAFGKQPLTDFWNKTIERMELRLSTDRQHMRKSLSRTVLELTQAVGDVAGEVAKYSDAVSEQGAALSHNERVALAETQSSVSKLSEELTQLINPTPALVKGQ